jgi:nucleotide-binding universal stress UspA family protein
MLERVLIPTDGSTGTAHVAMHGIDMAEQYGADIHVIHVIDTGGLLSEDSDTKAELTREGERAVGRVEAMGRAHDLPVETTVREGEPAEEILEYADEIEADIIVAGTHGRTGVKRHLIGSVAERLVRHGTCPVTTIRLPETDVTVESEDHAAEVAARAIEREGYDAEVTATEDRDGLWVVEAETQGGSLVIYIDAVTQRTRVLERGH